MRAKGEVWKKTEAFLSPRNSITRGGRDGIRGGWSGPTPPPQGPQICLNYDLWEYLVTYILGVFLSSQEVKRRKYSSNIINGILSSSNIVICLQIFIHGKISMFGLLALVVQNFGPLPYKVDGPTRQKAPNPTLLLYPRASSSAPPPYFL